MKKYFLILVILAGLFSVSIKVYAQDATGNCEYPNGEIVSETSDQCSIDTAGGGTWTPDASSLTPTTTSPATTSSSTGVSFPNGLVPACTPNCGFSDLMTLINNIISFILFVLAVPIAAIMFTYAGFLLITAGGETASARTKAKNILLHTIGGLVVAVAAWLIIHTILSILGYSGSWIGL